MGELAAANSRHTAAADRLRLLVKEIPSGRPDGVESIREAGRDAHDALEIYVRALKRFSDFTVNRVIPSDPDAPKG